MSVSELLLSLAVVALVLARPDPCALSVPTKKQGILFRCAGRRCDKRTHTPQRDMEATGHPRRAAATVL